MLIQHMTTMHVDWCTLNSENEDLTVHLVSMIGTINLSSTESSGSTEASVKALLRLGRCAGRVEPLPAVHVVRVLQNTAQLLFGVGVWEQMHLKDQLPLSRMYLSTGHIWLFFICFV